MRVDLHKPVVAARGDTVVITAKLPRGQEFARLSIWSAAPGFEMSPHVFTAQISMMDSDGRPQMVRPLSVNLHEKRRSYHAEFVSDDDLVFVVKQDIDVPEDPKAKAKVQAHGKTVSSLRRHLRNAVGTCRNLAASAFRRPWRNLVVRVQGDSSR